MGKEIEVKIQADKQIINTAEQWLDANAQYIGNIHHIEYYLNRPAASFFFTAPEGYKDAFDYLRVRITKEGDSFCYKKFHMDPVEKTPLYCDEYEVKVSDGSETLKLMKALGYIEQTKMEKKRKIYTFKDFEIVIDDVADLGMFIEVELKVTVADVKTGINMIYDFFKMVGINKFKLQKRGYVSMLWNPEFNFGKEIILQ
jgi:adenylate cyclase class 2